MLILGIETSCDETSVALVSKADCGCKVLSVVTASQADEHSLYGGVVPEIASRRHCEAIVQLTAACVAEAGVPLRALDAVAATNSPGLIGALLVGVSYAKSLCYALGKPLVPVNHIRGHIAALYLSHPELKPPFLCLAASGGNTMIIRAESRTSFTVLGETLDDAAGECFDKAGRVMGFDYPAGALIEAAAANGDSSRYKLPYPKTANPLDFSFSGLKTAVVNLAHNAAQKGENLNKNDLAASFQRTVIDILTAKLMLASRKFPGEAITVTGGVAANGALRAALPGALFPEKKYCGDNAAMIAAQGAFEFEAGNIADMTLNASAQGFV